MIIIGCLNKIFHFQIETFVLYIEVRKRKPDDSDNLNDGELYAVIETRKPELDAIMEWLESEEKLI